MNRADDLALLAFNAAHDPILVIGRDERIVLASQAVEGLTGYAPAELVGQPARALAPERMQDLFTRFFAGYFKAPERHLTGAQHPLALQHKDGREVPVELGLTSVSWNGAPCAVCTLRTIAERLPADEAIKRTIRRLEERLSGALKELHILVKHAPAAIALLDRDMRYILASSRWLEDYKLEGDIIGKSHYELFPELPERWKLAHQHCLAGESQHSDEDIFERADGTREYVRWELIPWRDVDGDIGGLIIFSEVITPRKLAELAVRRSKEQLEERVQQRTRELDQARTVALRANAAKTRFLAAASHDLRQPLQAASLFLAALEHRVQGEEKRTLCQKTGRAIANASDTLSALLDVARLEDGVLRPNNEDFAVAGLLEHIAATYAPLAEAKKLRLVVDATAARATSDPALLGRIVDNFVSNAIKYTSTGEVRLGCVEENGALRLYVADTGMGIARASLEKIFGDYVQLDNPDKDAAKGFGLGLAIVKTLADALQCELKVTSEPGRGSEFSVIVPRAAAIALAG